MSAPTNSRVDEGDPAWDILLDLMVKLRPHHDADRRDRQLFMGDMVCDGYIFRIGRCVIGIAEIDEEGDEA